VTDDLETTPRPRTRGECARGVRPCPWVSCRHHLALDVYPSGRVREYAGTGETCSLDVADRGGVTLEEVGEMLGISKEAARQMEDLAMDAMRMKVESITSPRPDPTEARKRGLAAALGRTREAARLHNAKVLEEQGKGLADPHYLYLLRKRWRMAECKELTAKRAKFYRERKKAAELAAMMEAAE
jgi:hypothetical protein